MRSDDQQPIFILPRSGKVLDFLAVTHKLTSEQTGGSYYLFESDFDPETGNGLHIHRREIEIGYVLKGALEIRSGDQTRVLEAGGVAHLPKNVPPCDPQSAQDAFAVPVHGHPRWSRPMVRCTGEREDRWFAQRCKVPRALPAVRD